MNKTVSFKKEIDFESIYQISSISLEHNYSLISNVVKGNFIVSGSYKVTEASAHLDDFSFQLPFEISIDNKYDISNINIDINDFNYEVIGNKTLSLNIEVIADNLEEVDVNDEVLDLNRDVIEEDVSEAEVSEYQESIFNGLDDNEKYVSYKIHIIGENDSVDLLTKKYNIKKSVIAEYNDLNDLKIGDKVIIPNNEN